MTTKKAASKKAAEPTSAAKKPATKKGAIDPALSLSVDAWVARVVAVASDPDAGPALDAAVALCVAHDQRAHAITLARASKKNAALRTLIASDQPPAALESAVLAALPPLACDDQCTEGRASEIARVVSALPHLRDELALKVLAHAEQALAGALDGRFGLGRPAALVRALWSCTGTHADRARAIARTALVRLVELGQVTHTAETANGFHSSEMRVEDVLSDRAMLVSLLRDPALRAAALTAQAGAWNEPSVALALADSLEDVVIESMIEQRHVTPALVAALVGRGRAAIARRALEAYMASYVPPRSLGGVELALLGDPSAKSLLASESPPGASLDALFARVTLGVEPISAAIARVESLSSPVNDASTLAQLARKLRERDPSDPAIDAALAKANELAAREPGTDYDRGMLHAVRFDLHREAVALAAARGDRDAARSACAALVDAVAALQGLVKIPYDKRFEAAQKAQIALDVAAVALSIEAADLALEALRAVGKAQQPAVALEGALLFLPRFPALALAVLDAFAIAAGPVSLQDPRGEGALIVQIGAAVLAQR